MLHLNKNFLDSFLVVEKEIESCYPYRLVLAASENDFVVVYRGTEHECCIIKSGMESILNRIFKMRHLS